jgi:hypothetical protein
MGSRVRVPPRSPCKINNLTPSFLGFASQNLQLGKQVGSDTLPSVLESVENYTDDAGALCFIAFAVLLAIIFIAGKVSDCRKHPPG